MFSPPASLNQEASPGGVDRVRTKRSRVGRACDACRNKRVKCDGRQPTCIPCTNYGIPCTYLEKPKHKSKIFKSRTTSSVGGRLARVEELLNARTASSTAIIRGVHREKQISRDYTIESPSNWSGQPLEAPGKQSDIEDLEPCESRPQFESRPQNNIEHTGTRDGYITNGPSRRASSRKGHGSLVINDQGDLQYLGPSSGFAVLSQATELLRNGNAIHQQLHMSEFDSSNKEVHDACGILLPPKDVANGYIEAYFTNSPFPLFHRSTFQKRADMMYTEHPPTEKCFRASWNMILAFGSHYTGVSSQSIPLEETEGWRYFTRAHDRLPDLLQGSNLSALQALLLIVQYLQFTSRASRWTLMGACAHMAQALGLHRDYHTLKIDPIVREERKKVFWVCYIMDKTISMGIGRSSTLHDYDCDAALPLSNSEYYGDNDPSGPPNWLHHTFVHNIRLSQIISKVYRKLYSAQSVAGHTIDSLADAVGDLDEELMSWRSNIPAEYRPEFEVAWQSDALHQHVLQLHLGYYNCLYNIHRAVFTLPSESISSSYVTPDRPLHLLRRNRIYGSSALAIGAARASLRLVLMLAEKFPGLVDVRIWLVLYYPFSAVIAMFIAIMRNPRQSSAKTDLNLITAATQLVEKIHVQSDLSEKMKALTSRFQREANSVLECLHRKNQDRDGIERFSAAATAAIPRSGNSYEGNINYVGMDTIPSNSGSNGNSNNQLQHNSLSFGWSDLDHAVTDLGNGGGNADIVHTSLSTLPGELPHTTQPSIWQGVEVPDLWQAPLNFEWDQWEAYVEKFPGESFELNDI